MKKKSWQKLLIYDAPQNRLEETSEGLKSEERKRLAEMLLNGKKQMRGN